MKNDCLDNVVKCDCCGTYDDVEFMTKTKSGMLCDTCLEAKEARHEAQFND